MPIRGLALPDGVFWLIPIRGSSARTLLQGCFGAWPSHDGTFMPFPVSWLYPAKPVGGPR